MKRTFITGAAAAMLVLLSGCGGGGGGGGPSSGNSGTDPNAPGGSRTTNTNTSTGPVIQIRAVMTTLYQNGQFFAKQDNVINGATYGVVVNYAPAPDSLFEGALTKTENITRDVTKNNATYTPYVDTKQTDYFTLTPSFGILGRYLPNQPAAQYYVTDPGSLKALPETGKPGDTDIFYTSKIYNNPTQKQPVGTSTQNWTVVADGASTTTAIFCINSTATITGLGAAKTTQDCYRINNSTNPNTIVSNFFTVPGA